MNKVILLGNVGRDPRMRMVDSSQVADFPLATTERRTSRTPDGQEMQLPDLTEWHNIVMWGRAAEFAEKYIRKGSRLLVEGKLRTRSWEDHNAIKRYITEVYVDSFELLPK
ncbi:MAG: single-stranded DNA-binding protein [Muribaculaceae bacterium]|jgi:single-strand DNA-binding protein|nr:single-stranded DNA-binding protein [Muribaculaceae bacterium]